MKSTTSDQRILEALGAGLKRQRLSLNMTQSRVATEAGVTRDTVRRMESGESVSTLNLVRVLRALGVEESLPGLIPDQGPGPLEQLRRGPAGRMRASGESSGPQPIREWRWGDGEDS